MSASCSICEKFETAWNKGDLLSRLVLGVGTTNVLALLRLGLGTRSDNLPSKSGQSTRPRTRWYKNKAEFIFLLSERLWMSKLCSSSPWGHPRHG
ncbi:hypothetical protein MTP99_017281 [Tenebrio molitor]|nr:hypothetical protein MTP99_017281 [Tenebrio molitor]